VTKRETRQGLTGTTGAPCPCQTGGKCNGSVASFRRQDKHGAAVVTSYPDCTCKGNDYADRSPVGARYSEPRVGPKPGHGAVSYPDSEPLPNPPAAPLNALRVGPTPTFAASRAARILTARAASASRETTTVAAPQRRSRRATLNTTVRGGASRATDIADKCRDEGIVAIRTVNGVDTPVFDRIAETAPLTGRQRRAAKKAAYQARLSAGKRGAVDRR